jgi:hypothetical protein
MNELAQLTYNQYVIWIDWKPGLNRDRLGHVLVNRNDFVEIMEMLDKRLNDKGKNWRHVFKVSLAFPEGCCGMSDSLHVFLGFNPDRLFPTRRIRECCDILQG